MKVVLKVLISALGLASIAIGLKLFTINGDLAHEVATLGNTYGLLPTERAFKNGAIAAVIAALGCFALVVLSFLKTPQTVVVMAVVSMGLLAASYFIQPDYRAIVVGNSSNSKDIALMQLSAGLAAAGLAMILSRRKKAPILTFA
jgi:hypothetical protein